MSAELLLVHASELLTGRAGPNGAAGGASRGPEVIADGAVAIAGGRVVDVGETAAVREAHADAGEVVDCRGRLVTPGLVDCHVHLLHAGSRHVEHDHRLRGQPPPEGMATGIAATVAHTAAATDADLLARAHGDLDVMLAHGTTVTEAKTGYGGGAAGERRLLALTAQIDHPVAVVPTFLGLHALPPERAGDREAFVDEIASAVPAAAAHAAFCDVFCDPLGFAVGECERVLAAAADAGLPVKVHADQTAAVGATAMAARWGAVSADHCDYADADAIAALPEAGTVAVLLPGVAHHLAELTPDAGGRVAKPHLPAQAACLVDAGAVVALSTDYNPGTSPTRSLQTVLQLAGRLLRLPAAAAWPMVTINAACALGVADERGSLEPGKAGDVVVWGVGEHGMVANRFGTNLVDRVYVGGRLVVDAGRRVA